MPLSRRCATSAAVRARVAHEQRHDRVLALDRLQTERAQAVAEPLRHGAQVVEQPAPFFAVDAFDGDARRLGFAGRDGVGVDVEGRCLAQVGDQRLRRDDVPAVDAKRLAERADQHIDLGADDLLGAASVGAEAADAVRVIGDDDDVLGVARIVLGGDLHDLAEVGVIAAHAEDAVRDDDSARAGARQCRQMPLQLVVVEVRIDALLGRARQRDGVDDRVVIERVADHRRLVGDERREHAHHRRVGGAEQHAGLAPVEGGEPRLQLHVRRPGAGDEAHGARPDAVAAHGLLLGLHHARRKRQSEIAVGVHAQERPLAVRRR